MVASPVQSKTGTASGTVLSSQTITLSTPTTAGNCLIVCVGTSNNATAPTVSGITLGGSADNFVKAVSIRPSSMGVPADAEIWADPNCVGGQTSVVISLSGAGSGTSYVCAVVYEVPGLAATSVTDVTSTGSSTNTSSSSWSSGATATTTQASELDVGIFACTTNGTVTGPSSPWVNTALGSSATLEVVAGYAIASATGAVTYAGSISGDSDRSGWACTVATFKGTTGSPATSLIVTQAVKRASYW